jgi:vacuolar protein sorting-associated protein 13A/C
MGQLKRLNHFGFVRGLVQMAPLVEFSVSGIQVSVHGRMEALSSTTNFTLSATTYNGKYDAWEPLIEPCDTFVR